MIKLEWKKIENSKCKNIIAGIYGLGSIRITPLIDEDGNASRHMIRYDLIEHPASPMQETLAMSLEEAEKHAERYLESLLINGYNNFWGLKNILSVGC